MDRQIRSTILFLIGTALLVISSGGACRQAPTSIPEGKDMNLEWARFFHAGNVEEIEFTVDSRAQLASRVERLVADAGGPMRLALTPDRVKRYRDQNEGLELAFAEAESLTHAEGSRVITPTRIFVLWTGDLVGESGESMVILHGYPEYSAGPLRVEKGRADFIKFVADLPRKNPGTRD